jgi:hypothetical protein
MTDKLSEEQCEKLTEFLGECGHEEYLKSSAPQMLNGYCPKCEQKVTWRTFTTPDDQYAVFTKLVETEKWAKFIAWCKKEYDKIKPIPKAGNTEHALMLVELWSNSFYTALFINQERFCQLAADYPDLLEVRNES